MEDAFKKWLYPKIARR